MWSKSFKICPYDFLSISLYGHVIELFHRVSIYDEVVLDLLIVS